MTRSQDHEIEIAAPAEDVWAAITEPEEMKKWYVEDASLEPHEGGAYHVSWGEGMSADARIEVWDPPRHLRLVSDASEGPQMPGQAPLAEDFTIEVRGAHTVLRLVFSNLPDSADWDAFYEGTNLGWRAAFALLKYCLERHPGASVAKEGAMGVTDLTPPQTWEWAVELLGASEGRYAATTPLGEEWSGEVIYAHAPAGTFGNCAIGFSIEQLGGSLFHLGAEVHGGKTLVYGGLVLFGDADPSVAKSYRDLVVEQLSLKPMS